MNMKIKREKLFVGVPQVNKVQQSILYKDTSER